MDSWECHYQCNPTSHLSPRGVLHKQMCSCPCWRHSTSTSWLMKSSVSQVQRTIYSVQNVLFTALSPNKSIGSAHMTIRKQVLLARSSETSGQYKCMCIITVPVGGILQAFPVKDNKIIMSLCEFSFVNSSVPN